MKKIIFDLDNTLMMFNEDYYNDYSNVIDGTYEDGIKLYKSIGRYEKDRGLYNRNELIDFVNNDIGTSYNLDTFNKLESVIATNWVKYIPDGTKDVLEYLYNRYELYVLTNWFSDNQRDRLKNAHLLKFFKEVVGSDKVLPKPSIDGYKYIICDTKLDDVIMIGDNVDIDIKGANDAGIKSILADYRNKYPNYENRITNIKELKKIL